MKFISYIDKNGCTDIGVLSSDGKRILPLGVKYGFTDMNSFIDGHTPELMELISKSAQDEYSLLYSDIKHLAPIPQPKQDIICLGINYMAHAVESARYKEETFGGERPYAVYFSKRVNEAVASGDSMSYPGKLDECLDYEAELAVIIGKDARNVSESDAAEYIFGYTVINDMSARTLQSRHKQWYFGKSLDGFTPMGPCILTADEAAFPPVLSIKSRVNGELRQNSTTDLLIFSIAHVISELSQGMTLKAGTIIAMGTPAGAGMGFSPPKFLVPGDTVECEIEKIGTVITKVI